MGSYSTENKYDVLIIGAGLSGLCSLIHLRKQCPSWRIKVVEAAPDIGGTWYWNRYPGCRFDSESISYGFSFDKELLEQWHWKEAFSPQPETHKYSQFIAEKYDLYRDIEFNIRIQSARWQDSDRTWTLVDESGCVRKTTFLVTCIGILSIPTLPNVPGINDFEGQAVHPSRWPKDFDITRDLGGKRIGVIGTGATGIQIITAISKEPSIKSLSVFQRTAAWAAPLRNTEISTGKMAELRKTYDDVFKRCLETPSCFMHMADPRTSAEVSGEERLALWEKLYAEPGFSKWLGVFKDTFTDREANRLYSDFMAQKIRERVHDPDVAETLVPKDHGFGTRRVPLESGYFEAYNRDNVHLVDLKKTPIERITKHGVATSDGKEHELDVLIYATGFDAITGSFGAIDWHAKDDRPLTASSETEEGKRAIWVDHRPYTFLGLTAPGLPNTFMVLGPHQPFGNVARSIEHAAKVVADMLQHAHDRNYTYIEATPEAADEWTDHVIECSKAAKLVNEVDSWMTGVNKNVKGKQVRTVARYTGSAVEYRRRCEEVKRSGYQGLVFA